MIGKNPCKRHYVLSLDISNLLVINVVFTIKVAFLFISIANRIIPLHYSYSFTVEFFCFVLLMTCFHFQGTVFVFFNNYVMFALLYSLGNLTALARFVKYCYFLILILIFITFMPPLWLANTIKLGVIC